MIATALVGPAPRIAVDHAGAGAAVMFLHGIGGNRRNWRANLPAVAGRRLALAWDARGYGDSDDDDGKLDLGVFAGDLARALDHFGVARAHLVGLSMGGRIAAAFHRAHPDRVRSLALCDTHLGFAGFPAEARREFVRLRKAPLLEGRTPRDIAPAVAETLIGDRANAAAFAELVDSMSRLRAASYIRAIEAMVADEAELYAGVRVPTLVLVGERDRLTPPAMAREIAGAIPGARLEIVAGAGHLPNIERPEAFNRALLAFLDAAEAG